MARMSWLVAGLAVSLLLSVDASRRHTHNSRDVGANSSQELDDPQDLTESKRVARAVYSQRPGTSKSPGPQFVSTSIAIAAIIGLVYIMRNRPTPGTPRTSRTWYDINRRTLKNVLVVIAWTFFGVTVLMVAESWGFVTSFYVLMQIVTTIGYGDITVTSSEMQWFMAVFVFSGVVLVAGILDEVANSLLDKEMGVFKDAMCKVQASFGNFYQEPHSPWGIDAEKMTFYKHFVTFSFFLASWAGFYGYYESCTCSYGITAIAGCVEGPTCVETGGATISYGQAAYMAVITMTTVGFGDYSPKSEFGRAFSIVWMLLSVFATARLVTAIAALLDAKEKANESDARMNDALFTKLAKSSSKASGDGHLSKEEFRVFCLLKKGVIDDETLEVIDATFNAMDRSKDGRLSYKEVTECIG